MSGYHPSGQENVMTKVADTSQQKNTYNLNFWVYIITMSSAKKGVSPNGVELHHAYDDFGKLKSLSSTADAIAYAYTYNLHPCVFSSCYA